MTQLSLDQWQKPCFGSFWKRYGAFLIDSLLANAITKILFNLSIHHLVTEEAVLNNWWYQLLKLSVFLGYFVTTMILLKGQTVGKYLLGLQVVSLKTGDLDLNTILVRELAGRTVIYFFPILSLTLIFTPQRQHLLDLLCDTVVIDLKQVTYFQAAKDKELILPKACIDH